MLRCAAWDHTILMCTKLAEKIPTVSIYSTGFFSLSRKGVRKKLNPDTLKWCSRVFK